MSKILILFFQPLFQGHEQDLCIFYESMGKELQNFGNRVMCANLLLYKSSKKNKDEFIYTIKNFNPDIIFTFNNQITEKIINNTSCPICTLDADGIDLFANKHFISKHAERYYMFSFTKNWEYNQCLELGIQKDKINYLHLATSIKNEPIEKISNISFIGTNFASLPKNLRKRVINDKNMYQKLLKYYNDQYVCFDELVKYCTDTYNISKIDSYAIMDSRVCILESLWDLGLNLYGLGWDELPSNLFKVSLAFDKTPKYSLQHNQDIYNSSKINISISHPQCRGYGFPWRIYDIMGSNGLLISSYSKLLEDYTKGIVNIPMFKSPYDARDLCKYALSNPSYCEDIIAASNEYVKKYGRWKDNFEKIESVLNIKLINNQNMETNEEKFQIYDFKYKPKHTKNKTQIKNFYNGICLALSSVPLISCFFSEKHKQKIINSINKYN